MFLFFIWKVSFWFLVALHRLKVQTFWYDLSLSFFTSQKKPVVLTMVCRLFISTVNKGSKIIDVHIVYHNSSDLICVSALSFSRTSALVSTGKHVGMPPPKTTTATHYYHWWGRGRNIAVCHVSFFPQVQSVCSAWHRFPGVWAIHAHVPTASQRLWHWTASQSVC